MCQNITTSKGANDELFRIAFGGMVRMSKLPLHVRVGGIPPNKWYTLNEICEMIGSSAKSYVKMTLFAMPNITWQRVSHVTTPLKGNNGEKWQWQFKRLEDTP